MKRAITILLFFAAATSLTAQNSCGTVKDYDGNTYATVQIGKQCWMKENLRTTHFSDGTAIPAGGDEAFSCCEPYYYDYSSSNIPLSARGYLYSWPAAKYSCPNGWHLPSDAEWKQLTTYVGSRSEYVCGGNTENIAKALASNRYWRAKASWDDDNECTVCDQSRHPNNASGFSAVPAGYKGAWSFHDEGSDALFWSSSQDDSYTNLAWGYGLGYKSVRLGGGLDQKNLGRSVRCLRD